MKQSLSDEHEHAAHPEHVLEGEEGTGRIEAFSDGVFAIAITLLVLDLKVPSVASDLGGALRRQWPGYLSYVVSFIIIGIIWAQHHQLFRHIKRTNHLFLLINVVFLMWVASLPFPAALLSAYLNHPSERRLAMAVYSGVFVIGALLFNLLWFYAARGNRLTDDTEHHQQTRAQISRSYRFGPLLYLVDFGLAFVNVPASLTLFFLIAAFYAVAPLADRLLGGSDRAG